jgi:hypothetical protein
MRDVLQGGRAGERRGRDVLAAARDRSCVRRSARAREGGHGCWAAGGPRGERRVVGGSAAGMAWWAGAARARRRLRERAGVGRARGQMGWRGGGG